MINNTARKTSLFIIIFIVLVIQGFSQKSFNVAVLNFETILQNSEEGKKASSQLLEKEKDFRGQLASINNKIEDLEKKLDTQKFTLSIEAQQQLVLDIDILKTKYKRYEEDSTKEYRQLQFRLFSKIRDEVLSIVEGVAKNKEFSLVLDLSTTGVWYFDTSLDITNEVIRRYDAAKKAKK